MPRHFPDFLKTYMQFVSGHEGTPRFHQWSAIAVIAGAMERKCFLDRGYYTLFPNLYVFLIGKSGLLKKSTTTSIAVNMLRKISTVRLSSERLTPASLIQQMHQAGRTFYLGEKEMRQSALFCYASELSVFMQEAGAGNISELLTTFYDCIPNDCNQPWIQELKSEGIKKIYGPCLNILGASTKAWLKKSIPADEMEGGFSSRIVFVIDHENPKRFVAWPKLSTELLDVRTKLEEDLFHIHQLAGEFKVSPEAYTHFEEWYEFHMKNIVPNSIDPRMAGYMGRKGELLLKLAMVRSVTLRDALTIEQSDILWAGNRLQDIELDMRDSFEGIGASPTGVLNHEIKQYLKHHGSVDKAELLRAFEKTASGKEVERALSDLMNMQLVKYVIQKEDGIDRPYFALTQAGLASPSL